jgi:hypothetical protein
MIVKVLLWLESKVNEWLERFDLCHICGQQAEYWCEGCDKRHCIECESRRYDDVDFCKECDTAAGPVEDEIRQEEEFEKELERQCQTTKNPE